MARIETIKGQLSFANYSNKVSRWYNIESDTIYEVEPTKQSKLNIKKHIEKDNLFKQYIKESFGDFFFNYYNKCINGDYIFRFMYLCTHMNYQNYIEFGNAKGENKLATKKDIKELLKLSNKQFYETYNYWIKNKMIIEDEEGYILVNNKFCNKGKIRRKDYIQRNGCVRMFNDGIKELYEQSSVKEHNQIGLLLKLLPYVNYSWNVICSNPEETDIKLIKPLKQKEIYEILNVDKKTIKVLTKITILNGEEGAFVKITNPYITNAYIINPKIMYKANNVDSLGKMAEWFKLGKDIN